MPGVREKFNERLRFYRKASGLSSPRVAESVGRAYKTVLGWEAGRGTPGIEDIYNLCVVYGVEPSDLFPEVKRGDVPAVADDDEVALLRSYRELGVRERRVVFGMVVGLADRIG